MSLITCGSIHEDHEWFSEDSRGRQEIFMCLAVVLCEQFCRFANGGAKSKVTLVPRTNHSQYSLPVEVLNLIVKSAR